MGGLLFETNCVTGRDDCKCSCVEADLSEDGQISIGNIDRLTTPTDSYSDFAESATPPFDEATDAFAGVWPSQQPLMETH